MFLNKDLLIENINKRKENKNRNILLTTTRTKIVKSDNMYSYNVSIKYDFKWVDYDEIINNRETYSLSQKLFSGRKSRELYFYIYNRVGNDDEVLEFIERTFKEEIERMTKISIEEIFGR